MGRYGLKVAALVGIGLLLTAGVVHADLFTTDVAYAWDVIAGYQNSQVRVYWYGEYVPFLHELRFTKANAGDVFNFETPAGVPWPPGVNLTDLNVCDTDGDGIFEPLTGEGTYYAGIMEYGVAHEDNAPDGGAGFQSTRFWELVHGDRTGNGTFTKADDLPYGLVGGSLHCPSPTDPTNPADPAFPNNKWCQYWRDTILVWEPSDPFGEPRWVVLEIDDQRNCTTGNCKYELVTTIFVNLDQDCDRVMDEPYATWYAADGLWFYAEAETPVPPYLRWSTPLQARIGDAAGDKTVSFKLLAPTAVHLSSFTARWYESRSRLLMLGSVTAVLGAAAVGALVWRTRPAQR